MATLNGGQHDAGVAELVGDRLQVRSGQQHPGHPRPPQQGRELYPVSDCSRALKGRLLTPWLSSLWLTLVPDIDTGTGQALLDSTVPLLWPLRQAAQAAQAASWKTSSIYERQPVQNWIKVSH